MEVAAKRNPDLDDSEIAEDQTIIDVIDKERKLELVQEGHRFFDARRLGKIIVWQMERILFQHCQICVPNTFF